MPRRLSLRRASTSLDKLDSPEYSCEMEPTAVVKEVETPVRELSVFASDFLSSVIEALTVVDCELWVWLSPARDEPSCETADVLALA